ncbi:MAG: DUF2520 domain-containing protein [Ferruginibacter sp.]|nr:DUF2520 domain-containing protein [Ferruginibacter sp.]MCC7378798.1 DUF2520 domain-containing protein [Chitinophagaceae bacterium]
MQVVIIGSGNVATVLGRVLVKNNHKVLQVVSRHPEHAKTLADELGCTYCDMDGSINTGADIYIVAISDGALYGMHTKLKLGKKLIVHTAGSVPLEVLKDVSENYGVLYPLQSLRGELNDIKEIPFLIDGNTVETFTLVQDFAKSISSMVVKATDEERLKLHVAAVVVSNFSNHLFALAEEFCQKEHVNFKLLTPLILETAQRTATHSPANMQTGPAMRNDVFTLDKHLRLLTNHQKLRYIYLKLTDSILREN